jgi:hypothetical protein
MAIHSETSKMQINVKRMKEAGFVVEYDNKHGNVIIYPMNPVQIDLACIAEQLDDIGVHPHDGEMACEAFVQSIHTAQICRAIKQQD